MVTDICCFALACRWGDNGLEYDQNAPRQALCDWLDKAGGTTLFDFVTKGILTEAIKNCEYWRLIDPEGRQPGLTDWWPSKSVTFIDNHDTGRPSRPQLLVPCCHWLSSHAPVRLLHAGHA